MQWNGKRKGNCQKPYGFWLGLAWYESNENEKKSNQLLFKGKVMERQWKRNKKDREKAAVEWIEVKYFRFTAKSFISECEFMAMLLLFSSCLFYRQRCCFSMHSHNSFRYDRSKNNTHTHTSAHGQFFVQTQHNQFICMEWQRWEKWHRNYWRIWLGLIGKGMYTHTRWTNVEEEKKTIWESKTGMRRIQYVYVGCRNEFTTTISTRKKTESEKERR